MILSVIRYLSDLAYARPWTSWIMHALLAVPICWAFGPAACVTFYLLREAEQIVHAYVAGARQNWVDHFLDVWAPAAVSAVYALVVG